MNALNYSKYISLFAILFLGGCQNSSQNNHTLKYVGKPPQGALCNPTTGYVFCPLTKKCARLWEDKACAEYCKSKHMKDCDEGRNWCKTHPKACAALGKAGP